MLTQSLEMLADCDKVGGDTCRAYDTLTRQATPIASCHDALVLGRCLYAGIKQNRTSLPDVAKQMEDFLISRNIAELNTYERDNYALAWAYYLIYAGKCNHEKYIEHKFRIEELVSRSPFVTTKDGIWRIILFIHAAHLANDEESKRVVVDFAERHFDSVELMWQRLTPDMHPKWARKILKTAGFGPFDMPEAETTPLPETVQIRNGVRRCIASLDRRLAKSVIEK